MPSRAHKRGASRSSRNVGLGMRWTLWRQAGFGAPGETFAADGEVVWSWRRDPGVKPRGKSHAGDGGKKGRFTGESTKEAVTPLRGESRVVPAEPVVTMHVSYLCFGRVAAGAVSARLSLRPLFEEGQRNAKTRAKTRRGNANARVPRCGPQTPLSSRRRPGPIRRGGNYFA